MADHRAEIQRDLAATVEARRELGPSYEAELVESFCDRIDAAVQQRVEAGLSRRPAADQREANDSQPFVVALVSLGTAVPITAISGGIADVPGMALSWLGIVGVNVAFALGRRRRR